MATTATSQRLKMALALKQQQQQQEQPPPLPQMQKSRPTSRSHIAQAARASQTNTVAADATSAQSLSAKLEQTFGLSRRSTKLKAIASANEENSAKSSAQLVPVQVACASSKSSPSKRPTSTYTANLHLKHLETARAVAVADRAKQPTWKSSTSVLYKSPAQQQQQQAIERRQRGAESSLIAATSLLQLNTPQTSSSAATRQREQQQIANQRRASSLATEISLLKSRSAIGRCCGSTQHLEPVREASATFRRRYAVGNTRVSQVPQRARSVVALNTYAKSTTTTTTTTTTTRRLALISSCSKNSICLPAPVTCASSKQSAGVAANVAAAVTNSRVRQGVLFARRQLHLTPVASTAPALAHKPQIRKIQPQVIKQVQQTSATTTSPTTTTTTKRPPVTQTTTCRRQLTRLTRAQPRPIATKKQAGATQANKLASVSTGGTETRHLVGTIRQQAHLLFESASRRARAGHNQDKKFGHDSSSSSSSLDAPIAHIKRPRAEPPPRQPLLAQAQQLLIEKRRTSLAAATNVTGDRHSRRRRWSSLGSGTTNEASSTPLSCSSLSRSSSSSCLLVVAVSSRECAAPVDRLHEERTTGRQRRRAPAAGVLAVATPGNRYAAADAMSSVGAGRARRQHVVDPAAASFIADAELANTRDQQANVQNTDDNDERISDIKHSKQETNFDYSSNILIKSNSNRDDHDKLFPRLHTVQVAAPDQSLIICHSTLTSNLDSNQCFGCGTKAASKVIPNDNNNSADNNNYCVCIVGRQHSASIDNANCGHTSECFHSKSVKHQLPQHQSIGDENVTAPVQVADRALTTNIDEENEPMVLSTDEPQHYQSGSQLESLESTLVASTLQLHQHWQQQGQRQSQSSSPMSCDLGEQAEQDENTNLVAIPAMGALDTTTTISEQAPKNLGLEQLGIPNERRESSNQVEMPAATGLLKTINIEQIQNQVAIAQKSSATGACEHDDLPASELGPASKRHQSESIVAITECQTPLAAAAAAAVKSNPKTELQISICQEPIGDVYDLETRPFARGKFAQVKRCVRRDTRQCYAAKCIKKRRRLVDIKHEILLEIEALKLSYQTKYIVKLYEVYETPNEMVLILEMANGGELQRVLDDEEAIEEPLVRKMIKQILEGLVHLHDNHIAHLDIKPQNLLLTEPFPNGDVKLCDFGISRRITQDYEIRDICGTPDYVAPEILRYDPISLATDMWSLGVLTYVLLSGYSPFGSENKQQTYCNITQANLDFPIEIFGKISEDAVDFIRKLIVREPSGRLTSRQALTHHWINY